MPNLHVANCNHRQHFLLQYRVGEYGIGQGMLPRERRIGPMSIETFRDVTDEEFARIEKQLRTYGAIEAAERPAGERRIERIFSKDPIGPEKVRKVLAFNVELMKSEGRMRLRNAAAALSQRTNETLQDLGVNANLQNLEVWTQEDSDDPRFSEAVGVTPTETDVARTGYTRRNRRRKA
jgi:hypothetical protein